MQGKRLLLAVIGGVAALTIAAPVLAFEMSAPDGWYLEGNLGTARLSNTNYDPGSSINGSGIAYNLNLGYKFMPYVAVEGGYTSYHNSKIDFDGVNVANVSHYSFDLAAKGILPIGCSGFEAFAKLGAAHMRTKITSVNSPITGSDVFTNPSNATNIYLGLGGQLNVMPELGIVAQWQRAQGNSRTGSEDFYSIGLAFIFV